MHLFYLRCDFFINSLSFFIKVILIGRYRIKNQTFWHRIRINFQLSISLLSIPFFKQKLDNKYLFINKN